MKTHQHIESNDRPSHPLAGFEWLHMPGLLLALVGGAGLLRWYAQGLQEFLSSLKFPPAWACMILLVGGGILLAIAVAAGLSRRRLIPSRPLEQKWRTL